VKLGIAGTGRMGSAIGLRLLRLGHQLVVWNRTPDKTRPLVEAGAKVLGTPAAVADEADVVLTILTDAAAIDAVYLGPSGLLTADVRGKLFLEMSTVRPEVPRALAAHAVAKAAALIDCPVGGTVGPASEGNLLGLAGGDAASVERARPLLEQLCRKVEHIGPVGAGATVKLAMNLTTQVYWQALGEALTLCMPLQLPAQRLLDLFVESTAAPRVLHHRAPDIAAALTGKEIEPVNFDIDSVRKDMRAMVEEAHAHSRRLPLAELALLGYDQVSRAGLGAVDCGMVPAFWAQQKVRDTT